MEYKTPDRDMTYMVVRNTEHQYSIWRAIPCVSLGWEPAPKIGSLDECFAYVNEFWPNTQPLSADDSAEYLA